MRTIVIIILSIVGFLLGVLLLIQIAGIKDILPVISSSDKLSVKVIPESSQLGTSFLINAVYTEKREQQDLNLRIESLTYSGLVDLYDDGLHSDKDANDGVYGGYFDSTNKPLGNYDIKNQGDVLTSFKIYESNCEFIEGVPGDDKINFVIVPSGYTDYNEFKKDALDLLDCNNCFFNKEPFKSNEDRFSFSIVNISDLNCEVGCHEVSTIVCCDSSKVLKQASQCHADSIYVLVNDDAECGSSSSFAKICSKNFYANRILMHELGHSFADLADEYVYSDYYGDYNIGIINNANCDDNSECSKWTNITDGCYKGCTYSNLYRSTYSNSVMVDLYPEYNPVCREHIKDVIQEQRLEEEQIERLMPSGKSYFVNLRYENGNIEIKEVYLIPVKAGTDMKKSDYSVKINLGDNEKYSTSLYVPKIELPVVNSSPVVLNSVDFSVVLPYIPADNLVVYDKEKPVAKIFLPFADKCGNGICDKGETNLDCSDCSVENDNFCQTSECDPNCASQKNCEVVEKTGIWTIGMGIGLFVIILVIIWLSKKR